MNRALVSCPLALMVFAFLALAGCDDIGSSRSVPGAPEPPRKPAAGKAFSHAIEGDISGDYRPVEKVAVAGYRLDQMSLGQAEDFEVWEATGRGAPPFTLTLAPEAGGAAVGVMPMAYGVTDGRIRFVGLSPEDGAVGFDGRVDADALAIARRNLGDEGAVITGRLTIDGQSRDVRLRWSGGDV